MRLTDCIVLLMKSLSEILGLLLGKDISWPFINNVFLVDDVSLVDICLLQLISLVYDVCVADDVSVCCLWFNNWRKCNYNWHWRYFGSQSTGGFVSICSNIVT